MKKAEIQARHERQLYRESIKKQKEQLEMLKILKVLEKKPKNMDKEIRKTLIRLAEEALNTAQPPKIKNID